MAWRSGSIHLAFGCEGTSPQDKHDRVALLVDLADHRIGEPFPAFPTVRMSRVGPHRKNGVQQQNALPSPGGQMASSAIGQPRSSCSSRKILTSDGGGGTPGMHGEAQPVGLARVVVRILAQQKHADAIVRSHFQRRENLLGRRIDRVPAPLVSQEGLQPDKVRRAASSANPRATIAAIPSSWPAPPESG